MGIFQRLWCHLARLKFLVRCFNVGYHVEISPAPAKQSPSSDLGPVDRKAMAQGLLEAGGHHSSIATAGSESNIGNTGSAEIQTSTGLLSEHTSLLSPLVEDSYTSQCHGPETSGESHHQHGQHDDSTMNTHQVSFSQDGFVSALSIFMLLIALNISLALTRWISYQQTVAVEPVHLNLVLSIQMFVGVVVIITILCNQAAFIHEMEEDSSSPENSQWQTILSSSITIICMSLFLLAGCFRDIFPIAGISWCMSVYQECGLSWPYTWELISRILRIIFMASEFLFCLLVHKKTMKQTWWVQYSLFTLMATTLGVWAETFLNESKKLFGEYEYYTHCLTKPENDLSNDEMACMNQTTSPYEKERDVRFFTYTVHIEFALLVVEILCLLIFSVEERDYKSKASNCHRSLGGQKKKPRPAGTNHSSKSTSSKQAVSKKGKSKMTRERQLAFQNLNAEDRETYFTDTSCESDLLASIAKSYGSYSQNPTRQRDFVFLDGKKFELTDAGLINLFRETVAESTATGPPPDMSGDHGTHRGDHQAREKTTNHQKGLVVTIAVIVIFLSALLSIVHLVLGLFIDDDDKDKQKDEYTATNTTIPTTALPAGDFYHYKLAYEIWKSMYQCIMVFVCLVGYWACEYFTTKFRLLKQQKHSGPEILMILGCLGFYIQCLFSIYAGTAFLMGTERNVSKLGNDTCSSSPSPDPKPVLSHVYIMTFCLARFLNLAQFFLQTTLLIHIRGLHLKGGPCLQRNVLFYVALWLMICNGSLWAIDSFIERRELPLWVMTDYYLGADKLDFIKHTLTPFSQLYRITSFFLFVHIVLVEC